MLRNRNEAILGADNKAAVATIMGAVRHLADRGGPPVGLELVFTTMEEPGLIGRQGGRPPRAAQRVRLRVRPRQPDRRADRGGADLLPDPGPLHRRGRPRRDGARAGPQRHRGGRPRRRRDAAGPDRRPDHRQRRHDQGRHGQERGGRALRGRAGGAQPGRRGGGRAAWPRWSTAARTPPARSSATWTPPSSSSRARSGSRRGAPPVQAACAALEDLGHRAGAARHRRRQRRQRADRRRACRCSTWPTAPRTPTSPTRA